jgi:threonyl-tRNA synthetase
MDMMDSEAEMSSLPMMKTIGNKVERTTEISVASYDENTMNTNFEKFVKFLEKENISYKMI